MHAHVRFAELQLANILILISHHAAVWLQSARLNVNINSRLDSKLRNCGKAQTPEAGGMTVLIAPVGQWCEGVRYIARGPRKWLTESNDK